ncbi:hypothetical protein OSCT_2789 [Oscillochloris trichoides DG-6]|uniref:DUF6754 domain-containing protein n=1 Tax=Oscillochloris trichoides DG-6 TaxID=765420 RepID=E1IHI8_9CHLR|nr:DUF6754 domain-containing protein [Oscillochloris trichoides]EFO79351.1 hypothetical protein OSCT_2789 [Oscillochloris trichoides DG-6]
MSLSPQVLFILLVTLMIIAVTWLHHARVLSGKLPTRRPLPALDVLRNALRRGAETGRVLHISPGAGQIGSGNGTRGSSAETLAGLMVATRISEEAALNGAPILVSSGDAVTHLALRGIVRQAYQQAGQTQDYDPARVQLLAHQDEFAYATGVKTLYGRQPIEASTLVGSFGQEYLLIGEEGAQRDIPQVVGTTNSTALPMMMLTTPATLIGEEIFASEAYLSSDPTAQARLLTQDTLRTVVILLIIGAFVYGLLQPAFGLPVLTGS